MTFLAIFCRIILNLKTRDILYEILQKMPSSLLYPTKKIAKATQNDKKVKNSKVRFVVPQKKGCVSIMDDFTMDEIKKGIDNISKMMSLAENYYKKTGLKEIVIYDTFSPKNIYSEKVQYEDYVKKHNRRFKKTNCY